MRKEDKCTGEGCKRVYNMTVYPSIEKMSTKRICSGECRAYRERAELLHSRQRGQLVGGDVQLLGHPGGGR